MLPPGGQRGSQPVGPGVMGEGRGELPVTPTHIHTQPTDADVTTVIGDIKAMTSVLHRH